MVLWSISFSVHGLLLSSCRYSHDYPFWASAATIAPGFTHTQCGKRTTYNVGREGRRLRVHCISLQSISMQVINLARDTILAYADQAWRERRSL